MATILIVEDELKIARFLELELSHEGYEILLASTGTDGINKAFGESVDLVLLDVMLPEIDGLEVLRRLRRESDVPVILLTARDELSDKVIGLDLGADDYITKPFRIEELLARIRAALRRSNGGEQERISVGGLEMDVARRNTTRNGRALDLTKREFDLLEYLMRNRGVVLTRDQIIERVWGRDYEGDSNVVDVYIRYLRAKVDANEAQKLIRTVRGVGYCIREGDR